MPTILIVDDDRSMVRLLELALAPYRTIYAPDGLSALSQVDTAQPDLVMLDLMLPDSDGLVLIAAIRRASEVPIIVLSARDDEVDRALARRLGAADFIRKPFRVMNLRTRVQAALNAARRSKEQNV
ncbi:MAG TPA: response regulator [Candidatus Acidoferrum sp.]|nr:response regulator [Candidatus Acidoferrum sp.]HXJ32349.1 response regulator [Gemmatimonadales bacterium]